MSVALNPEAAWSTLSLVSDSEGKGNDSNHTKVLPIAGGKARTPRRETGADEEIPNVSGATGQRFGKEACLVVIHGSELGKKYNLNCASLVIGRSSKCDIQIDQESISRNHSKVVHNGKSILLRDLGSTNGTYVNDEPIDEYLLRDGDLIKVGRTILKFLTGGNIENAYHEEIYRASTIDPLTRIYNRRFFVESLNREFARSSRYGRDVSVIAFLPDKVESQWGTDQEAAEDALQTFAAILKGNVRAEDMVGRHSDRILVGFFPEVARMAARSFCETLIERVATSTNPALAHSTISVGLADIGDASSASSLLKEVLRRLDAAKRLGGNRIVDFAIPIQQGTGGGGLQSTFISYGGPDQAFAKKLNEALKIHGVQTFFFQDDAPPGDKIHDVMRDGVNAHDRVILVCSKSSLERPGLLNELDETLAREARDGGATYLLPIRLDDYVITGWNPKRSGLAQTIRDRVIADFRAHEDPSAFGAAITKVLAVLGKTDRL